VVDLDDPSAVLLAIGAKLLDSFRLTGDYPRDTYPVPPGAEALGGGEAPGLRERAGARQSAAFRYTLTGHRGRGEHSSSPHPQRLSSGRVDAMSSRYPRRRGENLDQVRQAPAAGTGTAG